MLSRTASELYWLSRYLERAENMARMLDVSYSLSLMPQDGRGAGLDELAMPLMITGTLEDYQAQHGELDAERMLHFFCIAREQSLQHLLLSQRRTHQCPCCARPHHC